MGNPVFQASTGGGKAGLFYGYIIVAASFVIVALIWGTVQSFGVFLKPLTAEFGWMRSSTASAISIFMVLVGLIYVLTGKLTDRFGPRVVITICGLLFGLGNLLVSRIGALWQLYLLYGVPITLGTSGSFVPLASTIARWFVKRRGLMTGLALAGIGAGTMVGPPVIDRLIISYGWRNAYLIIGIATMILLALSAQFLKRDPSVIGKLPLGATGNDSAGLAQINSGLSLKETARTRQFWTICLVYLISGVGPWSVTVHIVPHATDLGTTSLAAVNILTFIGGLNIAGQIGGGNIADTIGSKWTLAINLALMSASLFWLQLSRELWMFYVFAIVFGFGWGGATTMLSPIVADFFGLSSHGAILALVNFCWLTGGAIGAFATGYAFDLHGSYHLAYLGCAISILLGTLLLLMVTPTARLKEIKA
ncbi:MFS transporter [Chloroflexota bacterium]